MPRLTRDHVDGLLADYSWSLDTTQPAEFANAFTADGLLESPAGTFRGTAELEAFAGGARLVDRGWRHWSSSVRFTQSSENEATVRSYVAVIDTSHQPAVIAAAGTYVDELAHLDGRWRFRSRRWESPPVAD